MNRQFSAGAKLNPQQHKKLTVQSPKSVRGYQHSFTNTLSALCYEPKRRDLFCNSGRFSNKLINAVISPAAAATAAVRS